MISYHTLRAVCNKCLIRQSCQIHRILRSQWMISGYNQDGLMTSDLHRFNVLIIKGRCKGKICVTFHQTVLNGLRYRLIELKMHLHLTGLLEKP